MHPVLASSSSTACREPATTGASLLTDSTGVSGAGSPRVLVVGNRALHQLLAGVLALTSGTPQFARGRPEALRLAEERGFDLILLDVDRSVLAGMAIAAHIRRIEREKPYPRRALVVACTSSDSKYRDCLFPGSALSGALKTPWTPASISTCLERWCTGKFSRS